MKIEGQDKRGVVNPGIQGVCLVANEESFPEWRFFGVGKSGLKSAM